jgi:hypothetical protein
VPAAVSRLVVDKRLIAAWRSDAAAGWSILNFQSALQLNVICLVVLRR